MEASACDPDSRKSTRALEGGSGEGGRWLCQDLGFGSSPAGLVSRDKCCGQGTRKLRKTGAGKPKPLESDPDLNSGESTYSVL